jgi:hypothetical protein
MLLITCCPIGIYDYIPLGIEFVTLLYRVFQIEFYNLENCL